MNLLPKDVLVKFSIVASLQMLGKEMYDRDPLVIAKYFHPFGNGTWFATEYHPENKSFFGFVTGISSPDCDEWGYFSLSELQETKIHGLSFERDLHFGNPKISEVPEIRKIEGFHKPLKNAELEQIFYDSKIANRYRSEITEMIGETA